MIKKICYCDYCGKKITLKDKINIRSLWWIPIDLFLSNWGKKYYMEGDGCKDCYESFNRWIKSRKKLSKR